MLIKITPENVNDLKKWFYNYVQTFKTGDEDQQKNIALKEEHTIRVCQEILDIGNQLKINKNKLYLSEIIALLHDIGRFEQYAVYKTFVDSQSVDHAALGVKILKKSNILGSFDLPVQDVIFRTILYHNRATVPREETETCLFFTRLLRDADKLDILKVVTDYYHQKDGKRNGAIELGLPDTPEISEQVYQDLINKKIVNIKHVKNLNDFKLLQVGWVFDINFTPTLRHIKARRYVEMIRDVLPECKKTADIFAVVQSFLNEINR
ncbi:hypothetical protein B1H10_06740 [candidate division KSB1 bacterium 4484_188]|nr:MAG: hypothetical protein B1H10_06740 [candidate division KSB1 bacterium 4484_188]HFE64245.1 HD domain-containing protein [Caldithrix sp.]